MQWKVKDYIFVCKYKHKRAIHDPETHSLSNSFRLSASSRRPAEVKMSRMAL